MNNKEQCTGTEAFTPVPLLDRGAVLDICIEQLKEGNTVPRLARKYDLSMASMSYILTHGRLRPNDILYTVPSKYIEFPVGSVVSVRGVEITFLYFKTAAKLLGLPNFVTGLEIPEGDYKVLSVLAKKDAHNPAYEVLYGLHSEEHGSFVVSNSKGGITKAATGKYALIPNTVVVIEYLGEVFTVGADNKLFEMIVTGCMLGKFEDVAAMCNVKSTVATFTNGDVTIKGDVVLYKGEEVSGGLVSKILELHGEGDDSFIKYTKFMEKVELNPSFKTRKEIFKFIEAADIELNEDGDLVCWKAVSKDFKDHYTKSVDNSVGNIVEMPREKVDDNSNNTCSNGFHCCSEEYLKSFWYNTDNSRFLKVIVDPKDVVSIPVDYNFAKMRTCRYFVQEEVTGDDILVECRVPETAYPF